MVSQRLRPCADRRHRKFLRLHYERAQPSPSAAHRALVITGRRPAMSDPNRLQDAEQRVYGFWNSAGTWVSAHPKTAIVIALVVIAVFVWLVMVL